VLSVGTLRTISQVPISASPIDFGTCMDVQLLRMD
jgi:hypothetical protein